MLAKRPSLASRTDRIGDSPLHYVAKYTTIPPSLILSSRRFLRFLVNSGGDVNAKNSFGQTPLHMCRSASTIEALLLLGARTDVKNNLGRTVVHLWMFEHRYSDQLHSLTINDLCEQDHLLRTPLHYAHMSQFYRDFKSFIIQFVTTSDNSIHSILNTDRLRRTLLHYVGRAHMEEHFEYLINQGADEELEDIDNATAMLLYCI